MNCHKLQAFVHVSSAFANCLVFHIEETYYTNYLETTAEQIIELKLKLKDNNAFDRMQPELLKKYPNTYCYTKSLAEDAILRQGANLPCCIFRPGISKSIIFLLTSY